MWPANIRSSPHVHAMHMNYKQLGPQPWFMLPQAQADDSAGRVPDASGMGMPWGTAPMSMGDMCLGHQPCMGMGPTMYRGPAPQGFTPDGMPMPFMPPPSLHGTAEGGVCGGPLLRTGETLHDMQPMRQMHFGERPQRSFNGWTVIWVGDRPPKSQSQLKEQIEVIGFLVKHYRSHDKCSRALDKKALLPGTSVFLVSQSDAPALLTYLQGRGASGLRIIIEQDPNVYPPDVPVLPECLVSWAPSWAEVLGELEAVSREASCQLFALPPQGATMGHAELAPCELCAGAAEFAMPPYVAQTTLCPMPGAVSAPCVCPAGQVTATVPSSTTTYSVPQANAPMTATPGGPTGSADVDIDDGESVAGGGYPWTLIWISEQAFKPAAAPLKKQLEALGGQVKGYKTNKNATRALDKKRALTRTIVLVSGAEASAFMQYLTGRKDLIGTRVVVEASSRSAPVKSTTTCEIAEDFEKALAVIRRIANDPEFR